MKYFITSTFAIVFTVAPLVGAWIEIPNSSIPFLNIESLPSWERGLKYSLKLVIVSTSIVAPLVGAWIEIDVYDKKTDKYYGRSPRGSVD